MSNYVQAVKFAIVGTVVGTGAGLIGDYVNGKVVMPFINQSLQGVTPTVTTMLGRTAMQLVTGAGIAGCVILAGDQIMNMISGDDPLFRLIYYQVAFQQSGAAQSAARSVKAAVQILTTMNSGGQKKPDPTAPCATAGTCGL
jgi:hypothetical protein